MRSLEELLFQVDSEEQIREIMQQIKEKTNRRSHQSNKSETQIFFFNKKSVCLWSNKLSSTP
jgi:hypothetical protein